MELMHKTIQELAPLLSCKEISPVELVRECLEQIEKTEPIVNAYITVIPELALQQAQKAEQEIFNGRYRGILHGIPYSAKDLYATQGIKTTGGSAVLKDNISVESASVIQKLEGAGAILVGKNNLHEFAYGTTNENEYYGACHNPWALDCITGGSSGGSAASVAVCSSVFSLGTDTGGSIRIPAALCGVTGIKPTYGLVSKRGVIPLSWSMDHVGPLAKSAWDAAAVLQIIAGYDALDAASVDRTVPVYTNYLNLDNQLNLRALRIGISPSYYKGLLDEEIESAFWQVVNWFVEQGAQVQELSYPTTDSLAISSVLTMSEAYTYHAERLAASCEDYGFHVRKRLEKGQFVPAHTYINVQRLRKQAQKKWADLYKEIDVFLSPTTITPAFAIGSKTVPFGLEQVDPQTHGILTYMTALGDFNGRPIISIPCGYTKDGRPIGVQIQGRPFEEKRVFQVACQYQQEYGIADLPPICV